MTERTRYIVVMQDAETGRLFKAYIPAVSEKSAVNLAHCFRGVVVGEVNDYEEEIYYEEEIKKEMLQLRDKYEGDL